MVYLIHLIARVVAYIGRYVILTNKDVNRLANRLKCHPKELAEELHMSSALFGR